jgi:hypothetical protein
MSYGTDRGGNEKRCGVCGDPTQSHVAPNGWVCHTCWSDLDEDELLDAVEGPVLETVGPDTTIECLHCETEYTLRESLAGPGRGVRPGDGFPLSDTYAGFVIVACTTCTKVTECLTTSENARDLADLAGVSLMTYHRRKGWEVSQ